MAGLLLDALGDVSMFLLLGYCDKLGRLVRAKSPITVLLVEYAHTHPA